MPDHKDESILKLVTRSGWSKEENGLLLAFCKKLNQRSIPVVAEFSDLDDPSVDQGDVWFAAINEENGREFVSVHRNNGDFILGVNGKCQGSYRSLDRLILKFFQVGVENDDFDISSIADEPYLSPAINQDGPGEPFPNATDSGWPPHTTASTISAMSKVQALYDRLATLTQEKSILEHRITESNNKLKLMSRRLLDRENELAVAKIEATERQLQLWPKDVVADARWRRNRELGKKIETLSAERDHYLERSQRLEKEVWRLLEETAKRRNQPVYTSAKGA